MANTHPAVLWWFAAKLKKIIRNGNFLHISFLIRDKNQIIMPSGGKREGSGRKPAEPGCKRVQMMITIAPETRERLTAAAKKLGTTVGRLIDESSIGADA